MPDLLGSELETAPETEPEPTCEICDVTQSECECPTCSQCSERYNESDSPCDCNEYCSRRCAERADHYHCSNCDQVEGYDCGCSSCEHCGERFDSADGGYSTDGGAYCSDRCLDRAGRHYCGHCGEAGDQSTQCSECARCESCCNGCGNDDRSDYIRNYGCKSYPAPIPATAPSNYLYLGLEVETEAQDESLADIADAIHSAHSDEILMKEDGSLDRGIELVSGKYSLEAHKNLWPRLCKTATDAGLRSWDHKTTGLHVHLSRAFFTQLEIGKFVVFLNSSSPEIAKNRRKLAGRDSCHYAKVTPKKLTDKSASRYEAVNLTNAHTIEVRIFKGTLKPERILACAEFCHAVAYWVRQTSIADIESWGSFWAYVSAHPKTYKHLIAFFA